MNKVRLAGATLLLAVSGSAAAFDFQNADGTITGSLDTTLSYGQAWRAERPDLNLIATADGGRGRSPNIDDGNLNYRSGDRYSQALKAITEFSLKRGDFGIFVRGQALYDFAVMDRHTARTEISDGARSVAGSYTRFLDAFGYGKWTLGDGGQTLGVRVGKLVLNWGESTFIQGGVNSINPVDVSALRVPGAELREAFLPVEMLHLTFGLSTNLTAEAFYQFRWRETRPEPVGTYFSSNDFVPLGGNRVVLGFGAFSDQGVDFRPLGGPLITDFQNVKRGPTIEASDNGQYGVAFRFYAPDFSNGTEFGLYFMRYNSRVPLISGRTGTQAGVANSRGALVAVSAAVTALAAAQPPAAAIGIGANAGASRAAADGGNLSQATAAQYATIAVNMALAGATQAQITAQATNLGTHEYAKTASYYTEFPDNLKLIGASFNTQLGTTGIALQGELTYKMDVPLQFDDVEVLFAALTPFEAGAFALQGIPLPTTCPSFSATLAACGQLGSYGVNQVIRGWGRYDIWQYQMTGTRTFAQVLGADQLVVVAEAGVTHVADMPSKTSGGPNGRGLRFNGPGTSVSGNLELSGKHFGEVEPADRFPDATSWGYRIGARLEYPGLLGAWNLSPRLAWSHDVSGTTPGPGGNFIEDRHALTVGLGANLQSTWELDLNYTQFGGAGRWNDLNDRDFVAFSAKYSF